MWIVMYVAMAASVSALVGWYASVPEVNAERIAVQRNPRRPSEDDWA